MSEMDVSDSSNECGNDLSKFKFTLMTILCHVSHLHINRRLFLVYSAFGPSVLKAGER